MKKLMIAAAIVCAAAMSQAASISWGNGTSSKITDLNGTALSSKNATTYAFQIFLVDSDGVEVKQASGIDSMTAGVLYGASATYTYGTDYANGDTFSILAKMTVDGTNYEMTINPSPNAIAATGNDGKDVFSWTAGTYGGLGKEGDVGKWVAQSVPEPTSGLLLLLGMAGLALRRRRA